MNFKFHSVFLTDMISVISMCVGTCLKQDVNFFLLDLRVDGCLLPAKANAREVLKTCCGRLNRAHPGLAFGSVCCNINNHATKFCVLQCEVLFVIIRWCGCSGGV